MKKLILPVLLLSFTLQNSFADCRGDYLNNASDGDKFGPYIGVAGGLGILGGSMMGLGLAVPVFGVVVVGAAATAGTAIAVIVRKNKKMFNLINDSEYYINNHGKIRPGKTLKKLYEKTKEVHPDMSVLELATYIKTSNDNRDLCRWTEDVQYFKDIKHGLNVGAIIPVELDDK